MVTVTVSNDEETRIVVGASAAQVRAILAAAMGIFEGTLAALPDGTLVSARGSVRVCPSRHPLCCEVYITGEADWTAAADRVLAQHFYYGRRGGR